jgi:putative redox protein
MKVIMTWEEGLIFEGTSEDGRGFCMDSKLSRPPRGTTPMETLLMSLAGCTGMDAMWVLNKKQIKVDEFKVEASAEQCEEHPQIFTSIHVKYIVAGDDVPLEAVERAVNLSHEKYCPVIAMLSKDAEITHEIDIRRRE